VQATPSEGHGAAPGRQPSAASHVSAPLQNKPSLQTTAAPPPHAPATHASPVVQALLSEQVVPSATAAF
jgi:hypothetical protein